MKLDVTFFGMQCFWGESAFAKLKGVRMTRVGYAGGESSTPTYDCIGDHSEIMEITFDPAITSYEDLLEFFWTHHDPTAYRKKQYQSAILYTSAEQKEAAMRSIKAVQNKHGRLETYIKPMKYYFEAESYHQKYWLRNSPFFADLNLTEYDIVMGVLAAKLNAYCAGYNDFEELAQLQKEHNLSDEIVARITEYARNGGNPRACH